MTFADEIREPAIKQIYEFWLARNMRDRLPLRTDIDPVRIDCSLLPHLFMYRLEPCGRFRAVLVGTEIVYKYRSELTGKYLDEIGPGQARDSRKELFERVVRERRPVYHSGRILLPTREQRDMSGLLLPVSGNGAAADFVFGILKFGPILRICGPDEMDSIPDEMNTIAVARKTDLGNRAAAAPNQPETSTHY